MNELKNPYGLVNGKLKHIKDINRDETILCPCCGEKLIVREGEKIQKHLSHYNSINCGGESQIHKLSKQYIYENIKKIQIERYKLEFRGIEVDICNDMESFHVKEKALEYRVNEGKYIPDIVLKVQGNLYIAIEIYYKNKKKKEILKDCINDTIINQVYEININDNDIENMDLDSILDRKELIYNKLAEQYAYFYDEGILKKNAQISNLQAKNEEYKNKIEKLRIENSDISKELAKYKNTDIDKIKWQLEMCKERLNEKVDYNGKYLSIK